MRQVCYTQQIIVFVLLNVAIRDAINERSSTYNNALLIVSIFENITLEVARLQLHDFLITLVF